MFLSELLKFCKSNYKTGVSKSDRVSEASRLWLTDDRFTVTRIHLDLETFGCYDSNRGDLQIKILDENRLGRCYPTDGCQHHLFIFFQVAPL